jgi:hypothetical protein
MFDAEDRVDHPRLSTCEHSPRGRIADNRLILALDCYTPRYDGRSRRYDSQSVIAPVIQRKTEERKMATEFCQKCKQTHPGRACDYDEKGQCAETPHVDEIPKPSSEALTKLNSDGP